MAVKEAPVEKGCSHHRHVGPCPSCQRAKLATLRVQVETCCRICQEARR